MMETEPKGRICVLQFSKCGLYFQSRGELYHNKKQDSEKPWNPNRFACHYQSQSTKQRGDAEWTGLRHLHNDTEL